MTRILAALFALTIGALGVGTASAQSSGVISQPFSLSAAGQFAPVLNLNGHSTCSVTIYNSGGGFTGIPQIASDGPASPSVWSAATQINAGSISTTGPFSGNVGGNGPTNFRFGLTALTSGTVTGVESCSPSLGTGAAGGTTSVVGTGTAGAPAGGVLSIQGVAGGVSQNTAFNSLGSTSITACDKTAVVNISTAVTTSIVAVSGTTKVYVCAFSLYVVSGTLPTFVIEGGTGAACVTTQVPLTGTFGGISAAVGVDFAQGTGLGALFTTAASSALCIVSGGTLPNIQGFVTYAQF